jgi:hypothetical protein
MSPTKSAASTTGKDLGAAVTALVAAVAAMPT